MLECTGQVEGPEQLLSGVEVAEDGLRIAIRNPHGHCGSLTQGVRRQTGHSQRSEDPQ